MSTIESGRHFDLEQILDPISCESFFKDHWEKQSLLIEREQQDHYKGLLSLHDVDQMIAFTRPVFTDQNAFLASQPPRTTYVRGTLADQAAHADATNPGIADLRQVFDQGKSVVIMGMQHRWRAVAELCRNLETVFHCPVHANMYLTPPGSQGFAAHHDPHEVFVLQLDGVKHWRLYDRRELLPLQSDNSKIAHGSLGNVRELRLKPGDLLYIPRGHVHDAYTTDSFSLHLTVGINVYRWADLMQHALTCAVKKEPRFRETIPGGALPKDPAELKQNFQQILARLVTLAEDDQFLNDAAVSLGDQFYEQLAMLPGSQFSTQVDLDQIGSDTVFEKHRGAICRVIQNDDEVAIEFPGNRVSGPHRIESALRFIRDTDRFSVGELPDDLNAQSKLVLVRRLIREGLLTPVIPCSKPRSAHQANQESYRSQDEPGQSPISSRETRMVANACSAAGSIGTTNAGVR